MRTMLRDTVNFDKSTNSLLIMFCDTMTRSQWYNNNIFWFHSERRQKKNNLTRPIFSDTIYFIRTFHSDRMTSRNFITVEIPFLLNHNIG